MDASCVVKDAAYFPIISDKSRVRCDMWCSLDAGASCQCVLVPVCAVDMCLVSVVSVQHCQLYGTLLVTYYHPYRSYLLTFIVKPLKIQCFSDIEEFRSIVKNFEYKVHVLKTCG